MNKLTTELTAIGISLDKWGLPHNTANTKPSPNLDAIRKAATGISQSNLEFYPPSIDTLRHLAEIIYSTSTWSLAPFHEGVFSTKSEFLFVLEQDIDTRFEIVIQASGSEPSAFVVCEHEGNISLYDSEQFHHENGPTIGTYPTPLSFIENAHFDCQSATQKNNDSTVLLQPLIHKDASYADSMSNINLFDLESISRNFGEHIIDAVSQRKDVLLGSTSGEGFSDNEDCKAFLDTFPGWPLSLIIARKDESKPAERVLVYSKSMNLHTNEHLVFSDIDYEFIDVSHEDTQSRIDKLVAQFQ
ncbi:hypothetical protein A6E01_20180 (plasmid) [Vibrio breoganii]|uniref:Uncharacterized protein n=1 Tax=Vibrio breoganii TaxID=553239 RepID=A0AAN0XZP0_9VIBR|nr:hypothetical protein [Vibrio breoganii]ANO35533.1 hypothetical protein A6E01_20180 [Vibrio breoganii]